MIHEVIINDPSRTTEPYWTKVPWLSRLPAGSRVTLKPGLNVFFGQNGSGKSTMLTAMAKVMHCHLKGYPMITRQSVDAFQSSGTGRLSTGLTVVHDGRPCRYMGVDTVASAPPAATAGTQRARFGAIRTIATRAAHQLSSGQAMMAEVIRFLASPAGETRVVFQPDDASDWGPAYRAATHSLYNEIRPAPVGLEQETILLDEPDRSVDAPTQAVFWSTIVEVAATGHVQFVIASHSMFSLCIPGAHYLETEPGYIARVISSVEKCAVTQLITQANVRAATRGP